MSRIQPPPRCKVCGHVYIPLPVDEGYCETCQPEKIETPKDYASNDDERVNWLDNQ